MKKTFLLLFLAVVTVFITSSCKDEVIKGDFKIEGFKIIATVDDSDKTYITEGTGGTYPVLWGSSDWMKVRVWSKTSGNILSNGTAKLSSGSGTSSAIFNLPSLSVSESPAILTAIHPNSCNTEGNGTLTACPIKLISTQNNQNTCYDANAYILVSEPGTFTTGQTTWSPKFRRAIALNAITLSGVPEGVNAVDVTISGKYLVGTRTINLQTGMSNDLPAPAQDGSNSKVEVRYTKTRAANPVIYFCTWGAVLTQGNTIKITASSTEFSYEKTFTVIEGKSLNLQEGCLNRFTLNMSSATKTYNAPSFTELSSSKPIYVGTVASGVSEENLTTITASSGRSFIPGVDKVRLIQNGAPTAIEYYLADYYTVSPEKITVFTSINRIGQSLNFYVYRGTHEVINTETWKITSCEKLEYYPFYEGDNWRTGGESRLYPVTNPESENPKRYYIHDDALREQLTKPMGADAGKGFGVTFDICEMCTNAESITGNQTDNVVEIALSGNNNIHSMAGLEMFKNLGNKAKDFRLRIWLNPKLTSIDFSNWDAGINLYNYHNVTYSTIPSPITTCTLGPNMTGFRWFLKEKNEDVLETLDCHLSKELSMIQLDGPMEALRTLDLRCKGGGTNSVASNYSRLANDSGVVVSLPSFSSFTFEGHYNNLSNLTIKICLDVFNAGRTKRTRSVYNLCWYLKQAANKGAKIYVYYNDWDSRGYDTKCSQSEESTVLDTDGRWKITEDSTIGNFWS